MIFSVITVNFNGGKEAADALASCISEGVLPENCVVVDNGSSDNSIQHLERNLPGVCIMANSCNAGFAKAVNQGLRAVGGDAVLILNNDARLLPGALEAFQRAMDAWPGAVLLGARLVDTLGRPQNAVAPLPGIWQEILPRSLMKRILPHYFGGRMIGVDKITVVPTVIGAAMVVRKSLLELLGYLDENFFFYLEETEWCARAHRMGLQVLFCPDARVEHRLGGTANRFHAAARIEFQRSRLLYAKKFEGRYSHTALVLWYFLKAGMDFLSNAVLFLLTLGLAPKVRARARSYGVLWLWHLFLRPKTWGLPGKCQKWPS